MRIGVLSNYREESRQAERNRRDNFRICCDSAKTRLSGVITPAIIPNYRRNVKRKSAVRTVKNKNRVACSRWVKLSAQPTNVESELGKWFWTNILRERRVVCAKLELKRNVHLCLAETIQKP